MRSRISLLITVMVLVVGATFAQDVRYNFDRAANFSSYKTYKWVDVKGADRLNDMAERQVMEAVNSELSGKGLQRVEDESADLYIGYQVALNKEKQFTSYSTDWGYGPGWGGGWYGGGMGSSSTSGSTSTIVIGQLSLDMYDRAAKSIVWRGVASKTLDTKAKPEKQDKNLKKAVAKLLKNYPPAGKK
jgi:hypothetical protein